MNHETRGAAKWAQGMTWAGGGLDSSPTPTTTVTPASSLPHEAHRPYRYNGVRNSSDRAVGFKDYN